MAEAKTIKARFHNTSEGGRFINTASGQVTVRAGETSDELEVLAAEAGELEALGFRQVSTSQASAIASGPSDKPLDKQNVDELWATAKAEGVEGLEANATKADIRKAIEDKRAAA